MLVPVLAIALGCHKTSASLVAPGPPTFQFTANGTVYHMNGNLADSAYGAEFIRKIGEECRPTDTMYFLQAKDTAGNAFNIGTEPITSLRVATYPDSTTLVGAEPNGTICVDGGGPVTLRSVSLSSFDFRSQADYSIITVTSIHQGFADGAFDAHLTSKVDSPLTTITITDGQFTNLPIVN